MAIDPADSRSLYLGIGSALWYSSDTGATWRKTADLAGRLVGHLDRPALASKATARIYAAGPNAIYIRRDGKWRSGRIAGRVPVGRRLAAGLLRDRSTDRTLDLRRRREVARIGGPGAAIKPTFDRRQRAAIPTSPTSPTKRTDFGVAKTTDRGRHWERAHVQRPRRLARPTASAPAGPAIRTASASRRDDPRICLRHRFRPRHAHHRWRQHLAAGLLAIRTPDGNWTTNGIDVTTCYGVHFDPFDRAPHVHQLHRYRPLGQR